MTDSQVRRIDQICDSFEVAWDSELQPRIEAFLDEELGPHRSFLLHELVLIDVEYRRQRAECPRTTDYQQRFPELDEQWLDARLSPTRSGEAEQAGTATTASRARVTNTCSLNGLACDDNQFQVFGKFRLLEKVGVGAFGTVWRALDFRLNRTVALKVPHAHLIQGGEEVARFFREARAVAQLRHPGIVTVHEVPVVEGLPVLVCEFVTGTSLRELMAIRRLPYPTTAALVRKNRRCAGLCPLHGSHTSRHQTGQHHARPRVHHLGHHGP